MQDETPREQLQALAGSLLRSREDERRSLARELHDDVSQRLARLDMDAYALERDMAALPDAQQRLGALREAVGGVSASIRSLSHRLHPSIIDDLGLAHALRSLTDEFRRREQIPAVFHEEIVPEPLPDGAAILLYRIAEEALRNVARHAGETHVEVSLQSLPAGLRVEIADFGRGFDLAESRTSLGLVRMQERAREAGATLHIVSTPGAGTRVTVELPTV